MADKLSNGLFIAEVMGDNAGPNAFDTDGDGNLTKADEYIEIQSSATAPLSLDGIQIISAKGGVLYEFGPGDVIAPGETATLVGEYTTTPPNAPLPPGYYEAGIPNNGDFLGDGENAKWDIIWMMDTNTGEYVVLSYGPNAPAPGPPPGFPDATRMGDGEVFDTTTMPNATAIFRDETGQWVEGDPDPGNPNVACLAAGTLVETARGRVPVEAVVPDDLILTLDGGWTPVLGVSGTRISGAVLAALPQLGPVIFEPGVIGNDRTLALSPSHRVLAGCAWAGLMFAEDEVLVAAHHYLGLPGVRSAVPEAGVAYYHLLCARHELIRADGAWIESLYLGDVARASLAGPGWALARGVEPDGMVHAGTARRVLRGYEAAAWLGVRGRERVAA